MYTVENYRSKAAIKRALAIGEKIATYQPGGMFEAKTDGVVSLEGPHFPEAHRWYAEATIADGIILTIR